MEPITDLDVARAQERAHQADEVSDNAGLDLAEAVVTGIGDVDVLKAGFVKADRDRHRVPA